MPTPAERIPEVPGALDAAAQQWAAEHLPELLADAGAQAAEMVTAILRDRLVQAALQRASANLGEGRPPTLAGEPPRPGAAAAPTSAAASEGAAPSSRPACYVYGVVPDGVAGDLDITAPEVRVITVDGASALVTHVDPADYDPPRIEELLTDEAWVERQARDHDLVLRAAMAQGPVLPFRFLTVVRDDGDVEELLRRRGPALRDGLRSVTGRQEWGLRIVQDREVTARALSAGSNPAPTATGAAWLAARQRRQEVDDEIEAVAARLVDECHDYLAGAATRSLLRPAANKREVKGVTTLLNASYLVADEAVPDFQRLAQKLDDRHRGIGLRLELTGPWPPYSFVEIEL